MRESTGNPFPSTLFLFLTIKNIKMYKYETEKPNLFTEQGQEMFLAIRDKSKKLLEQAGSFTMEKVISGQSGSVWQMLACVDRLVEIGEIKEVTDKNNVAAQNRVFI